MCRLGLASRGPTVINVLETNLIDGGLDEV